MILKSRKFCFPFVSEERGSRLRQFMTDIHKILLKSSVFSLLLEEMRKI